MHLKSIVLTLFILSNFLTFSQESIYDVARDGCAADMEAIIKEFPKTINFKNANGYTPLTLACYSGNTEVVEVLAKKVKDIDAGSNYGTPLMAAAFKGNSEIVKILIANGADVNASDANNVTALHYVVRFTNKKLIKLLVDNNADIHLKDHKGLSSLDYAIRDQDDEIIKILKKERL